MNHNHDGEDHAALRRARNCLPCVRHVLKFKFFTMEPKSPAAAAAHSAGAGAGESFQSPKLRMASLHADEAAASKAAGAAHGGNAWGWCTALHCGVCVTLYLCVFVCVCVCVYVCVCVCVCHEHRVCDEASRRGRRTRHRAPA